MTTYNQDDVKKRFGTLSPEMRKAIVDLDMGQLTDGLRKKYNIHVDQLGKIAEEITLAMVGLVKVNEFGPDIKAKTGLPNDIVNLITYDINQLIFSKIRRELEELTQERSSPTKIEPGPTPTQTPSPATSAPAQKMPAGRIFDEKMTSVANVPKQEVAVTPQTGDNKVKDPYLEPI